MRGLHLAVGLLALVTVTAACGEAGGEIQGVWYLESFTIDGENHEVEVGVNTRHQPWIQIGDEIDGNSGCNDFGSSGGFTVVAGNLFATEEVFSTLAGSIDELGGDSPMQAEYAFQEFYFTEGFTSEGIALTIDGDTMTWRASGEELVFSAAEAPPAEPTIPPLTRYEDLDCSPALVARQDLPRTGDDPVALIEELAPDSTRFETTTNAGGFVFRWTAYDDEDVALVVADFGDVTPPVWHVYTCETS